MARTASLHDFARLRAKSASVLSLPPLPRTLAASFRDLESGKPETRVASIRDLVRHVVRGSDDGRPDSTGKTLRGRAIEALQKLLRNDTAPPVRAEAATALAEIGATEALPVLLMAVEDEDGRVRQMALSAVGEIGDARASQRLARALGDARPEVRYQAVIAYARVAHADPSAVAEALVAALDDEDSAIRYIAMRVAEERLATLGPEGLDERLVARARQLVLDDNDDLAIVAGLYLARAGDPSGRELVLSVVAERRRAAELEGEQACVEISGELALADAAPYLERRVWGRRRVLRTLFAWGAGDASSCAWHARVALARMGHGRARAEILADLASVRRETREAAVVAAGRARIEEARALLDNLGGSVDAALVREALGQLAAP